MNTVVINSDFTTGIENFLKTFNSDSSKETETVEETNSFDDLLYGSMITRLKKESILDFYHAFDILQKGLLCARNNHLLLSNQYYSEADRWKEEIRDQEVHLLVESFEYPAKSYLYYKLTDYTTAESMLKKAIEIDDSLEDKGYDIMHFHKIQQLHNISRISYARKEVGEWENIMLKLLKYLTLGETPINFGNWNIESINKCPSESRSGMLFQVFSEVLVFNLYLVSNNQQDINYSIRNVYSGIDFDPKTRDEKAIKEWLNLNSLLEDEKEFFLNNALIFLSSQPNKFNLFKAYLLIDILKILKGLNRELFSKIETVVSVIIKNRTRINSDILGRIIKNSCYSQT